MIVDNSGGEGDEIAYDEDRSAKALAFLDAVKALCTEHGFVIGHEDGHGNFMVVSAAVATTTTTDWIANAAEVR